MTRPANYPYTGIFLSEVAAIGHTSVTVKCDRCAHRRMFDIADLVATHGDRVMPDVLGIIIARCPNWHEAGVSYPRCSAVDAEPLTDAEQARIKAARPPEPARDPRYDRRR